MNEADASATGASPEDLRSSADRAIALLTAAGRFNRTVARTHSSRHTTAVWRILATLDADGALRASQIAQHESVTQGSMTSTMQRLEDLGLVKRRDDPDDGRATLFEITEEGRREMMDHRSTVTRTLIPYLQRLSPLERAAVDRVVELMREMEQGVKRSRG